MTLTILDGSIGQELVKRSSEAPTGLWSTEVLLKQPELILAVHADYFAAGADVATSNSYAVHRDRMARFGIDEQFEPLLMAAIELATAARDAHGSGLVAGSIGPAGWSYRPSQAPPEEQGAEIYAEVAKILSTHADVLLFETMSSVLEAKSALMGSRSVSKPVWLAVSVDDTEGSKLRSGEDLLDILALAIEFQPEALLINCSVPEAVNQSMAILDDKNLHPMRLGAYANGFKKITEEFVTGDDAVVDSLEAREDLDPETYASFCETWIAAGADIVGGCCEVGPAHIQSLVERFKPN